MLMDDAPPTAVILDEAVELAKTYSTDGSPSFVNGVLSSIADEITAALGAASDAGNGRRGDTATTTP